MDVREVAASMVEDALGIFRADLEALPEEAFERDWGADARGPADLAYEVALVNDHVCLTLRGEPLFDWPAGWLRAPEGWRTKAEAIAGFERSAQGVMHTVSNLSEDQMADKVTTEHGETDVFERLRFIGLHTWYHSGQLNYMQTLLGDSAWHWS